jgi:hypothetical protein
MFPYGGSIEMLRRIEEIGRHAEKTMEGMTEDSAYEFVREQIKGGNSKAIQHASVTLFFVVDIGTGKDILGFGFKNVTQTPDELALFSNGHKSTDLTFILPTWFEGIAPGKYGRDSSGAILFKGRLFDDTLKKEERVWLESALDIEGRYLELTQKLGWNRTDARAILSTSNRCEIFVTANLLEWRHALWSGCSRKSARQTRSVMLMALNWLNSQVPVVFEDIAGRFKAERLEC